MHYTLLSRFAGLLAILQLMSTISLAQFQFDGSGKLLLSPPETITIGQPLSFTVVPTKADAALYFRDLVSRMDKAFVTLSDASISYEYMKMGVSELSLLGIHNEIGCWLKNLPAWLKIPLKSDLSDCDCLGMGSIYLPVQKNWLDGLYTISLFEEYPTRKDSIIYPIHYNASIEAFENASVPTVAFSNNTRLLQYDLRLQDPVNLLISQQTESLNKSKFSLPDPFDVNEIVEKLNQWDNDYHRNLEKMPQHFSVNDKRTLAEIDKKIRMLKPTYGDSTTQYCDLSDMIDNLSPSVRDYYNKVNAGFKPFIQFYSKYEGRALRWLWYTGGILTAHPFTAASDPDLKVLDHIIQDSTINLIKLRRDSTLNQAKKVAILMRMNNETGAALTALEKQDLIVEGQQFNQNKQIGATGQQLVALKKQKETIQKDKATLADQQDHQSWLLHRGLLAFRGNKLPFVLMRHHNAQMDYRLMSSLNNTRSNYLLDRQEVNVLIHNNRDSIKFTSTILPLTEQSIISTIFLPILLDVVTTGSEEEHDLTDAKREERKKEREERRKKNICIANNEDFIASRFFADNAQRLIDFYRSQFRDSGYPDPQRVDMKPAYFTQMITPQPDTLSSRTMQYTITNTKDDKAVRTEKYNISKTQRFLPFAGLGYSFYNQPNVTLNDDGSLKATKIGGFFPVVGLKIHFAKTNVSDPFFVYSPKRKPLDYDYAFDWRKIHLVLGVNTLQPLRSFVGGLGIDLWSGLSLQGGYNLIRAQQPVLERGITIDTRNYLTHGYFISLSVDPSLFGQIIKLFIKQ